MSNRPKLKPLLDRAFIEFAVDPDAPMDETKRGGIITPAGFAPRPPEGAGFPYYTAKIVAVGPEVKQIKIGDEIAIARNNVEKFSIGEHTFWQINERAVAGIVEGPIAF